MKLQDKLPDRIRVGRRIYKLDLDFRNVLDMMEVMGRNDLIPSARDYLALGCVMKKPPRNATEVMDVLRPMLFEHRKKRMVSGEEERRRLTDFEQDADMIRAAFRQNYGIDLYRERVHWLEFTALLANLPEGSRYADVLGIRARPMPAPTKYNQSEREWLIRAKRMYSLDQDEEMSAEQINNAILSLANTLIGMADQKEVKQHEHRT